MEVGRTPDEALVRSIVASHLGMALEDVTPATEVTVQARLRPGDEDPLLRSLHIHFETDFRGLTHRRVHWSTLLTLSPVAAVVERWISKAVLERFPPSPPYWNENVASLVVLLLAWGVIALAAVLYLSNRAPGEERVNVGQIEAAVRRGKW